jgi:hypothetical protein
MDKIGNLSEAELTGIKDNLSHRLKKGCWNCGEQDWLIFPTALGEGFYDAGHGFMTSAHLGPKIRLTCRNCGNIVYFSAESMGLNLELKDD